MTDLHHHAPLPAVSPRLPLRLASDEALARRAADGEDAALGVLFTRYRGRLEAYCGSIVHHPQDAGDAAQEALVKAMVALREDRGGAAIRPWLFRIAHNEAISLLRRRRPETALTDVAHPHARGPEEILAARDELRATLTGVHALPPGQRDALLLREFAGLPYDQIATALDVSAGAARQAVSEARTTLSLDRAGRDADCGTVREQIGARGRRSRQVRGHLRGCGSCRQWAADPGRRRRLVLAPGAALSSLLGSIWAWIGGGVAVGPGGAGVKAVAAAAAVVAGAVPVAEHELNRPARQQAAVQRADAEATSAAAERKPERDTASPAPASAPASGPAAVASPVAALPRSSSTTATPRATRTAAAEREDTGERDGAAADRTPGTTRDARRGSGGGRTAPSGSGPGSDGDGAWWDRPTTRDARPTGDAGHGGGSSTGRHDAAIEYASGTTTAGPRGGQSGWRAATGWAGHGAACGPGTSARSASAAPAATPQSAPATTTAAPAATSAPAGQPTTTTQTPSAATTSTTTTSAATGERATATTPTQDATNQAASTAATTSTSAASEDPSEPAAATAPAQAAATAPAEAMTADPAAPAADAASAAPTS